MTIHEIFSADHTKLREHIAELQTALNNPEKVGKLFPTLQQAVIEHFRKEDEVYYPYVDVDKKMTDRELMHNLRNDHAAVIFTLESLAIRLRKKVPMGEWKAKFELMTSVLLAHFNQEEKTLFPQVERMLSPTEFAALLKKVQNIGS